MLVKMDIKGLMLDPISNMPIVILRDEESSVFLPIWVGVFEANAIALQIEKVDTPRPMTHDLLRSVIAELGATVERIVINELRESTFYARVHVKLPDREVQIDSRPSDAIALALRTSSPIYVEQDVLDKAQSSEMTRDATDTEKLRKWLEEINPEELGKYKM